MIKKGLNVVYLGYSSFPYGLAEFQKILLISKALVYGGAKVKVIGSRGYHDPKIHPHLKKIGHFQGITYIYSWGTPYRINGFVKRNIRKLFEIMLEFNCLYKLNRKEKIDAAIISSMNFRQVLRYKIYSRLLGFKVLLNFVEHNSSMAERKGLLIRINDYLFDNYAVKIYDGILVISEYLIEIIKKIDPDKAFLKIPMMVDVERYNGIVRSPGCKYFLFCGAVGYKEIILFTIESFEIADSDDAFLFLVVNGNTDQLNEIRNRISQSCKSESIKLYSNISDRELSELYINASGLLIPLRPINRDKARFPHKFGEYLSSGNPVVTTNIGEVKYYFKDMDNALIADQYEIKDFADKMEYIIKHPSESRIIGQNGKQVALDYADYKKYGERIIKFIEGLE